MNSLFASTARGLEELLKTELEGLGAVDCQVGPGRGPFSGRYAAAVSKPDVEPAGFAHMLPLGQCSVYSDLDLYLGVQAIPWTEIFTRMPPLPCI
jgi:23S rRNA (guanine2445-N2)-methyltransferase / 23S rRNA (guanine2069-N7)-methyltransferase